MKSPLITILAIESSADETAASVVSIKPTKGSKPPIITTLSSVVRSQIKLHTKLGGIVPEIASRAHVKNILPVTKKALQDAKVSLKDIDYLAVTAGPGLIPSLIIGVEFTKALSLATGKPVLPINHMAGHLYSPFKNITATKELFPHIALIVSGGHTLLVEMTSITSYQVIGQTVDDAAGEAFDKVARLLKLPYPGGPEISRLAATAEYAIEFPRPMIHSPNFNFSFAGLKTAVLYYLRDHPEPNRQAQAAICAGFENAVIEVLVSKTLRAVKQYKARSISLSGGVSANTHLRNNLTEVSKKNNLHLFLPEAKLSTDNAEMIGLAAAFKLSHGFKPVPFAKIQANPNLEL